VVFTRQYIFPITFRLMTIINKNFISCAFYAYGMECRLLSFEDDGCVATDRKKRWFAEVIRMRTAADNVDAVLARRMRCREKCAVCVLFRLAAEA
jgi:hypothetical protein